MLATVPPRRTILARRLARGVLEGAGGAAAGGADVDGAEITGGAGVAGGGLVLTVYIPRALGTVIPRGAASVRSGEACGSAG